LKNITLLIQAVCALGAAIIVGNWFLAENRKAKRAGKKWYAVYLTPPGILIIAIILILPFVVTFL